MSEQTLQKHIRVPDALICSDYNVATADQSEILWIEKDVLPGLAGSGRAFVFQTNNWWSQIKTAGSAIYANRHYLSLYESVAPERLTKDGPEIIGNVFVHPSADVHPTAVVSICELCSGLYIRLIDQCCSSVLT